MCLYNQTDLMQSYVFTHPNEHFTRTTKQTSKHLQNKKRLSDKLKAIFTVLYQAQYQNVTQVESATDAVQIPHGCSGTFPLHDNDKCILSKWNSS